MATHREKFQALLKKLFQFDCAELDFGIYRIMNQKRAVIEQFIEKDLLAGAEKELKSGALAQESLSVKELTEVSAQIKETLGADALDAEGILLEQYHATPLGKHYLELRERLAGARSTQEIEADIFNHLYTFFSRYYDEGDFMSLRRYSRRDKYAIPYNGEEVHLHWANSDQYYIKTGENFTDYSYKHGGWTVRFQLRNADVEQNNVKGAKRFFLPRVVDVSLDEKTKTVAIPFEYRPLNAGEEIRYGSKKKSENGNGQNGGEAEDGNGKEKRKKGQEGIIIEAVLAIMESAKKIPDALAALVHEKRKDGDGNPVSLLDHHLRTYTRKNTMDFFIHKDLKGFLERELDFYLKNEVLNLDELEAGGETRSKSWFQMLRAIKTIGRKIIAFVAQIENLQKRLFEKKKFVTEVHYCVTLDRVPEEFYPEIAKNKAQVEEWKRLFLIHEIARDTTQPGYSEPLKVSFLKAHHYLVLDTQFFDRNFVDRLLLESTSIASDSDGLLICSENYQALCLLRQLLYENADMVYLDPPYNTSEFGFLYKNDYKHSSWLAMFENRLREAYKYLPREGVIGIAIDDTETSELRLLLDKVFGSSNYIATIAAEVNPAGQNIRPNVPARSHDYCIFYAKDATRAELLVRELTEEEKAAYSEKDEKGSFLWDNLRRRGGNSRPSDRPNQWFPLYANLSSKKVSLASFPGAEECWPIDPQGEKRIWRVSPEGAQRGITAGDILVTKKAGRTEIIKKSRMPKGRKPKTLWAEPEYSGTTYGTKLLNHILGEKNKFSYPKSVFLVQDCIRYWLPNDGIVVDYFGGSGTTGHAVINLNREDNGERKYVIVEMAEYFDDALRERIEKVVYSMDWKDGKPVSRQGSSHAFKYIRLESYEDALDNITFQAADGQAGLQLEDYLLSYMLDFETKESETLLNVAKLDAPFDYKLRRHGKDEPLPVDLPETFNYIIGLHVASRHVHENKGTRYLIYRGKAEGRETVILWRTTRGWGEKEFEADRDFIQKEKLIEGAEDIFVNTDSFIPGARSLDPVFKRRMFNEE